MSPTHIVDVLTAVISEELTDPTATIVEQELILVAARQPDLAELYRDWEKQGLDIFATGLKRSGYKRPQRLALVILNFIRGFLLERLTDPTLTEQDFKERALLLLKSISSEDNEYKELK